MLRRQLTTRLLLMSLVGLIGLLVAVRAQNRISFGGRAVQAAVADYENREFGVRFSYPASFETSPLAPPPSKPSPYQTVTVFRAVDDTKRALISLRRETGIGVLKLAGQPILKTLIANVDRRYPKQFPDYKKESFSEGTIAVNSGATIEFTYTGTDGRTRIRQRLVIVTVGDAVGYYLSFQAPEADFDSLRTQFDAVVSSLEFFASPTKNSPPGQ